MSVGVGEGNWAQAQAFQKFAPFPLNSPPKPVNLGMAFPLWKQDPRIDTPLC